MKVVLQTDPSFLGEIKYMYTKIKIMKTFNFDSSNFSKIILEQMGMN